MNLFSRGFIVVAATTLVASLSFSPAVSAADAMSKHSMHKGGMMKKDQMHKGAMPKDGMSK